MAKRQQSKAATLSLVAKQAFDAPQSDSDSVQAIADQLPAILQTTLELEHVINLFHAEIGKVISFDSLHYQHKGVHSDISTGSRSHHSCNYRLEMDSIWLGEFTLTRRKKFHSEDTKIIEDLLCKLIYPLRNCLLYRQSQSAALEDKLTGLNNRGAFDVSLKREIELAHRQHAPMTLLVLDIDYFKSVNDTYGHSSGDLALQATASAITSSMRCSDIAFRYGGEEFTLILSNTDIEAAYLVAERIRVAISQLTCNDDKRHFGFTASVGIAQLNQGEEGATLFERADKALYQAKKAGRNQTICATDLA